MTRAAYLQELRERIANLPYDEINAAIEYYTEYFEEAESDEKAMEELGTPAKLAESILQKIAGTPAVIEQKKEEQKNSETKGSMFFKNPSAIKNLTLNIKASQLIILPGSDLHIEYKGFEPNMIYIDESGSNLEICVGKKGSFVDFFNLSFKMISTEPTLMLYIPSDHIFDLFKITIGAGSCSIKDYRLNTKDFFVDVGAGEFKCKSGHITGKSSMVKVGAGSISLSDFFSDTLQAECGMGEIKINGDVNGDCKLVTAMGEIKMELNGNQDDYSVDGSIGLGDMKFGTIRQSGSGHYVSPVKKDKHFIVQVGMGDIKVKFLGN